MSRLAIMALASALGPSSPTTHVVIVSDAESTADAAAMSRLREAARTGGQRREGYSFAIHDESCSGPQCATKLLDDPEIDAVVVLNVDAQERDYAFRLELVAPEVLDGGTDLSVEDSCQLCGLEEVGTLLEDSMGALLDRYGRVTSPATVALSTTPAGADVSEGGVSLGQTPLEAKLAPGQHTFELRLPGYEVQQRTLTVGGGEAVALDATLVALPPVPKWRPLAIIGGVAMGVGVGSIAAGAALIAIDERSIDCGENEANSFGVCPRRYATLEGGAVAVALGGALLIGGAVVEAVALRRRARGRSRAHAHAGGLEIRF